MVKIICDRCKQETGPNPGYIFFGVEGNYCEKCKKEIKEEIAAIIARDPDPSADQKGNYNDQNSV